MAASGWTAGKGASFTRPRGRLGFYLGRRHLFMRMCSPADLAVQRHIEANRVRVRSDVRTDGVGAGDTAIGRMRRMGGRSMRTATKARGDVGTCQKNGTRKENQFQVMGKQ